MYFFSKARKANFAIAIVGLFLIGGCAATPSDSEVSVTLTEVAPVEPTPVEPTPDEPTPSVPAGFFGAEMGLGVAYRWSDRDCSTSRVYCYSLEVYAYEDCFNGVRVEANILDAEGRVVSTAIDALGSIDTGQSGFFELRDTTDDGVSIEITDLRCYQ